MAQLASLVRPRHGRRRRGVQELHAVRHRVRRNADWYQAWIDDSKDAYERLSSWGILDQYTRAVDTPDYFENLDYVGYREANIEHDRHKKFMQTLEDNDIPVADYTMITDVVKDGEMFAWWAPWASTCPAAP